MNMYKPEGMLISTAKNHELVSTLDGLRRALEHGYILEAPCILSDNEMNLHVSLGAHIHGIIPRDDVVYSYPDAEVKDIAILTRVGKVVCFCVMGFAEEGNGDYTVFLSRRRAQMECVRNYIDPLLPGDIIDARVTHLESFGAFVDIGCGVISLLPIDQISVSRIAHPSERISVSEYIKVVIKSKDDIGRIFVSTKELLGTWLENAARFKEGETVRATIRGIMPYGIFVELAPNLAGLAELRGGVEENQCAAVYIKSILPDRMKIKLIIIDTFDEQLPRAKQELFVDTSTLTHMDRWVYSPPSSRRTVEVVF